MDLPPARPLFATADNPLPEGAVAHDITTRDGLVLRAMVAPAPGSQPTRGTVVLLNGRADFLERYFESMCDLQARGFCVAGFDWRGQGGSERLLKDSYRGYIKSFRQFDEDLRAVMEDLVLKHCPGPYYALAHSTGGHVVLRNLFRQRWFSKAVVTSPLLDLIFGAWPRSLAFLLANMAIAAGLGWAFLPGFKRTGSLFREFDGNPLSSDARRWQRDMRTLADHSSLGLGGPTYAWLAATLLSIKELNRRSVKETLSCPTLVVLAGLEGVVDNAAAHKFAAQTPGVSLVTLKDAKHEILLESDTVRSAFFAAFDSFIATP